MKKCLIVLFMAITALASTARERDFSVSIVATSDVHGNFLSYDYIERQPCAGGLSRVQTYIGDLRRKIGGDNVILLDNGDILQGQPLTYYYNFVDTVSTHVCAAVLNYIGYDAVVVGNHDESEGIDEISINYVESGESFNRKTTIVDIFFASKIVDDLALDHEPKSMAACMKRSDWSNWKVAIEDELRSLAKR